LNKVIKLSKKMHKNQWLPRLDEFDTQRRFTCGKIFTKSGLTNHGIEQKCLILTEYFSGTSGIGIASSIGGFLTAGFGQVIVNSKTKANFPTQHSVFIIVVSIYFFANSIIKSLKI
jgi:hypothetical protein